MRLSKQTHNVTKTLQHVVDLYLQDDMRHTELHRSGSAVQAGVQLRGGCLGSRLHTVCPANRATTLRHGHA